MVDEAGGRPDSGRRIRVLRRGGQIGDAGVLPRIGDSTSLPIAYSEELSETFHVDDRLTYSGPVTQPWQSWAHIRDAIGASTAPPGREDITSPAVLTYGDARIFFVSDIPVPQKITLRGFLTESTPGLDAPIDTPLTRGIITKLMLVRAESPDGGRTLTPGSEKIINVDRVPPDFITGIYPEGTHRSGVDIGVLVEIEPIGS